MRSALVRAFQIAASLAMGLVLLTLPFTSLRVLSKLMKGASVAPAAIIFIFILTIFWLPVYLFRGGTIPREMQPFFAFVAAALIASAAAFFIRVPPYKGYTLVDAESKSLITLAIGAATYVVVALWHRETGQLRRALLLLNISGGIILLWSLLQLYFIRFKGGDYPAIMVRIQDVLSIRTLLDKGFRTRVGGFTYEPSWLAHQLNVLFIPYWLAATVTGYSAVRKLYRLSIENVLLVGGVLIMYYTLSRIGLLAFLFAAAYIFFRINAFAIAWLRDRLRKSPATEKWRLRSWLHLPLILVLLGVYAIAAFGLLFVLAKLNPRLGSLLTLKAIPANFFDLAFQVNFAERVVYWSIGWAIFARYPLLGVGLGNTGLFFLQLMPNISYRLPEIMTLVNFSFDLPNIKSFWIRLLAETGMVGFALFTAWQYVLWQAGKFLRSRRPILLRTFGWMAAFAILAFLAEGFSIDSFALPYLWVSMGLLTAASSLARRESA